MSAPRIDTKVSTNDEAFRARSKHNRALAEKLRGDVAQAALGGTKKSRERHVSRGKLLPRERVERLLDPGSPFLEIGQLAAGDAYTRTIDVMLPEGITGTEPVHDVDQHRRQHGHPGPSGAGPAQARARRGAAVDPGRAAPAGGARTGGLRGRLLRPERRRRDAAR